MSIWMDSGQPAGRTRGPKRTYSREMITEVAVQIADGEGLQAASMRRIASEIGAGVMTLYPYISNRDDLIELMVDHVAGDMKLPDEPGEWRDALSLVAMEMRAMWLRHPWAAVRTPGHPIWGPNSLRVQEYLLSALDRFGLSVDEHLSLIGLLTGYVESFVRAEVGWAEETRRTGVDVHEWMRRTEPYARKIVAEGRYPRFSRMMMETSAPHMEPDARFGYGLERVLDSIAASLKTEA